MPVNPFRKGPASTSSGNGIFAVAKEEEPLIFVPLTELDEIIAADMHEYWEVKPFISFPCIGAGCPACASGHQPKYKSYMAILVQGEATSRILPMGISIERALEDIKEELGTLKGRALKLKRTGKGFATRYNIVNLGKTLKIDAVTPISIEENITILDAAAITKRLGDAGLLGATTEAETETPPPAEKKAKAAKAPTAKEELAADGDAEGKAEGASLWETV